MQLLEILTAIANIIKGNLGLICSIQIWKMTQKKQGKDILAWEDDLGLLVWFNGVDVPVVTISNGGEASAACKR